MEQWASFGNRIMVTVIRTANEKPIIDRRLPIKKTERGDPEKCRL
jgi:hypothetical protein